MMNDSFHVHPNSVTIQVVLIIPNTGSHTPRSTLATPIVWVLPPVCNSWIISMLYSYVAEMQRLF